MPDFSAPKLFLRIRRVLAVVALLVFGTAALLSGSDRQSSDFPISPSYVGWPYDAGAARARAITVFLKSGPESAIGYARRSLLSDPISARSVSMLGRALLYSQHLTAARDAFVVSGQLGWRDELTQIYWLDQAVQTANYKVAAERLDSLLRQTTSDENIDRFLPIVAATPEGRAAIAERLKLSPLWAQDMVNHVTDVPLDQVLQRVDLIQRTGKGVWDCLAMERIAQKLISSNRLAEAQAVWRSNCENGGSLIYDGSFEHLDPLKPTTAFDWQLANRGDAEISLVDATSGQHGLALEVTATITLPIVRQLVVLPAGRYHLTWHTPGTARAQAQALRVSLGCRQDLSQSNQGVPVAGKPDTWSQDFTLDNACEARMLVFWLAPHAPVRLDDVSLIAIDRRDTN